MHRDWYIELNDFEGALERANHTTPRWQAYWDEALWIIYNNDPKWRTKYIIDTETGTITPISNSNLPPKRREPHWCKIYIGEQDERPLEVLKIGYTEKTCYSRCSHDDYTIFSAVEMALHFEEKLFVESYVRLGFNAMLETKQPIRQDYFLLQDVSFPLVMPNKEIAEDLTEWGNAWLNQFVFEAIEIINTKRRFSNTSPVEIGDKHFGYVRPYSY